MFTSIINRRFWLLGALALVLALSALNNLGPLRAWHFRSARRVTADPLLLRGYIAPDVTGTSQVPVT